LLKENNIVHVLADVGDHRRLGIVDRFSGVVKGWIARYQTYNQTQRYIDALQGMVKNYNNAPHSSIGGMTPNDAWKYPVEAANIHYDRIMKSINKKGKSKKEIVVGDDVRILKLRDVFHKGYRVKFSLQTHKVVAIKGLNYTLDNGKSYRASRLLKVSPPGEEAAPVRDVANEARRVRKKELILQQEGVDEIAHPHIRRSARERKPVSQLEDEEGNRIIFSKYK
jgi:hypothetical protein